jgi:sugar-specific transcriptional regulator TrmB
MDALVILYKLSYSYDNMASHEPMVELAAQLGELGLGGHEPAVYAALVVASPASATYLAKKCGLSRSSVYTTLSALTSKGLVGTTYKNDVKQFIAQDTDALERLLQKEKESAEKKLALMRSLKATFGALGSRAVQVPQIVFFEGQEGLKKVYLHMMRQAPKGAELYLLRDEFVWQKEWAFIFEEEWRGTIRRWKVEKGIKTKLLVNSSKLEKSKASFYLSTKGLEHRYLPLAHSVHQFALYVLGDTIAILSMEKNNMVGIKITNAHLADNYAEMFRALWQGAKK